MTASAAIAQRSSVCPWAVRSAASVVAVKSVSRPRTRQTTAATGAATATRLARLASRVVVKAK